MSLNISPPGKHCVYICYDKRGEAVYIGRTQNLAVRLRAHRHSSAWWPQSQTVEWVPCDGAVEARLTEREYIETFTPVGNINDTVPVASVPHELPKSAASALRELFDQSVAGGHHCAADARLNDYIAALNTGGWALGAIGLPLGVTREAIRLRRNRADGTSTDLPVVPPKPVKPPKPLTRRQQSRALLTPAVVADLRDMHALARRVTGGTPVNSPLREATVLLTETIATLVTDGVLEAHIGQALGLSSAAIGLRLSRHGYKRTYESQGAGAMYRGVQSAQTAPKLRCAAGHPFAGENVRFVNGDPHHRICRACERRRKAEYRERCAGRVALEDVAS